MSANCQSGSAKPQILTDSTLPSNTEFVIFSDEKCDGDCGYYRPGIPAHRRDPPSRCFRGAPPY
jgi:hypothetical protein